MLTIESEQEQIFILNELKELARDGFRPSSGDRVNYTWLGATDDNGQFAFNWVAQDNNYTTSPIGVQARETGDGFLRAARYHRVIKTGLAGEMAPQTQLMRKRISLR